MRTLKLTLSYDGTNYVGWQRQINGVSVQQMVEEAFAPLVRLHPAVAEVIPVAGRRWRHALSQASTWQDIGRFVGGLRGRAYDAVIDTQGLFLKSSSSLVGPGEGVKVRFLDRRCRVAPPVSRVD